MRAAITSVVLLLLAALAMPAGAAEPSPHVTDATGDANAINGQGFVTGGATGGTSTGPASYGPADLISVRYASTYAAIPNGNGTTYSHTGMQAHITTAAPAVSGGPTLIYRLNVTIGNCGGFVQYYANGPASAPTDGTSLEFRQFASRGCAADATIRPSSWFATTSGNVLTFNMPLTGLSSGDRANFLAGKAVDTLAAEVRTQFGVLTAPAIDVTAAGATFVIGSDRPADIPCTAGCA